MGTEDNRGLFHSFKDKFKDYVYGMTAREMARQPLKTRGSMEHPKWACSDSTLWLPGNRTCKWSLL